MVRVKAEEKGLTYLYETPLQPVGMVNGDERLLSQILINLLGNATKFTREGSVSFRISSTDNNEKGNNTFCFSIEDTGIGISKENLGTIFKPFEQGDNKPSLAMGTGLGLTISQRIVEEMGGELKVESELHKGSHFWFEVHLPPAPQASTEFCSKTDITGYKGERKRILIVDDEEANRNLLRDILTPLDFKLDMANEGLEALERTKSFMPDLILLDLRMPDINGLEVARRIRESGNKTAILAISACAYNTNENECLDAGCDDFIPKPFPIELLLERIGKLLTIEWIAEGKEHPEITTTLQSAMETPPIEMIEELYQLAVAGQIVRIKERLEDLKKDGDKYPEFVKKIKALTNQFKIKAVKELLKPYVEREQK